MKKIVLMFLIVVSNVTLAANITFNINHNNRGLAKFVHSHRMTDSHGKNIYYSVIQNADKSYSCHIKFRNFQGQKAFTDQLLDRRNKTFSCTGSGGVYVNATNFGLSYGL
ncbi:MAG: hypothetical protein HOE90_17855 [Bacteriovoracaceae bacterium]|jgi:hypothetical protein|nr:hypothetical protein [Bacteriovoracaceae bacterium]